MTQTVGYKIEHRELVAADYGAPTTRKRFVLVARCDGKPIVWPEQTHAPIDSRRVKAGKLLPWRSAAEIIDWTVPGYSIFATRQEIWERYGVKAVRPLADNTMRRIIRALLNRYCGYQLEDDEVILLVIRGIAYYIADITLRMLIPRELYNAMGFPRDYIIRRDYLGNAYSKTKQVARCGNAVCPPLAEAMVRANLPEWCSEKMETMEQFHEAVDI